MIKRISVTNHLDETLDLVLARPELSGLIVTNIDGLGPPTADINMTSMAVLDGALFDSARLQDRQISLHLRMMSPGVEESRLKTYQYFPIRRKIRLEFETDNRLLEISGYVSGNTPDIFSQTESTTITVKCPDPYFYAAGPNGYRETAMFIRVPLFEFPFANESLTERLIEFSSIERKSIETIKYDGDIESGILVRIRADGPVTNPTIYNVSTQEKITINTTKIADVVQGGFLSGDELVISTFRGAKGAYLRRDGQMYNILNCLGRGISWLTLSKGANQFSFTAESGDINLAVSIEHRPIYEGV